VLSPTPASPYLTHPLITKTSHFFLSHTALQQNVSRQLLGEPRFMVSDVAPLKISLSALSALYFVKLLPRLLHPLAHLISYPCSALSLSPSSFHFFSSLCASISILISFHFFSYLCASISLLISSLLFSSPCAIGATLASYPASVYRPPHCSRA
jgi:hypothetical protein